MPNLLEVHTSELLSQTSDLTGDGEWMGAVLFYLLLLKGRMQRGAVDLGAPAELS